MEARIVLYPLFALAAAMMYQATNPALYYMVGVGMYFWAFSEGEVSVTVFHDFKMRTNHLFIGHLREELDSAEEGFRKNIVQSLKCFSQLWIELSYYA